MRKTINYFLFMFFILSISISAQEILVNQDKSHELFVEILKNSKDIKYQEIIAKYDDYISKYPDDVEVKLFKCKFIGSAYYDEYEDYNLKYEETEKCIEKLYELYPNNPGVILYKLENLYGDERGTFLNTILNSYNNDKSKWNYGRKSKLFEISAYYFSEENDYKALSYAKKAERFSDSLDLSILISNIYLRLGNRDKAKENILSSLYFDSETWQLNQKGNLLIQFGEYSEALKIFERVKEKDSTLIDTEGLYKIFLEEKKFELARKYLVNDTINEWNKIFSLQKILNHDIKYSNPETALKSYRRVQQENYYDDLLGIKRLKIFFKSPFKLWTYSELSHILILLFFICIIFLIPYLWILPVYAYGKYFSKSVRDDKLEVDIDWNLNHFWLISFFYLLSQTIIILAFYYQDYINSFLDVAYPYYEESLVENELSNANSFIFFSVLLLISTIVFINKKRIKFVFNSNLKFIKMLGYGILFVIGNGILLKLLGNFVDLTEAANTMMKFSIKEEIGVLMSNYGFTVSVLFIAVIIPFSEEIIFRGIILSSSEKHIGFNGANLVQAILFGIVHFNFKLFVFYFIFGLITGYAVKRTKGLLTGIIFHAINNFFVLLVIYMMMQLTKDFS